MFAVVLMVALAAAAWGADLVFPPGHLERTGTVPVTFRTNRMSTGKGKLHLRWTDVHGRLVEDRAVPITLTDENELRFGLDLTRAAAMRNKLEVQLELEGKPVETARATFIASPPDRGWWDYHIIMWQNHKADQFARLKDMGVDGGQFMGRNRTVPEFLLRNDLRWYAEGIGNDYYAEYHRYFPDRRKNWAFFQALELHKREPLSKEPFKRNPSFSDPVWLNRIRERFAETARFWSPYRPFFYSLADEAGVADLSQYWDFDFSDHSLGEMRIWLKERYGTLAALNGQWGTNFADWQYVAPQTTNEAMQRQDGNYSSWSDHKEWMDVAFARALRAGTDAVLSVDPRAYVGILGAQMPGWGGYDYARLVKAVNMFEPYDIGNNHEIIRSFAPHILLVTTAFATGPWEKHRVWYELLHGNRGLILWDDKSNFVAADGTVGERGREMPPYYRELRGGIGALLINSERLHDPIAIHYSQASLRAEWMREQRPKGAKWIERRASTERLDSEFMRLRESWCRLIEDLGYQYRFVSYDQVESDELIRGGYKVLVLPRSSALSASEAAAISAWVHQGGTLVVDGTPGEYDEKVRKLERPLLADLTADPGRGKVVRAVPGVLDYHQHRLINKEGGVHLATRQLFESTGVRPLFASDAGVGMETHTFRNGGAYIVGLLPNPQLRVNELGPPEFKSNARFEQPRKVRLSLPAESFVYDSRSGKALGRLKAVDVMVDPYEPVLLVVTDREIPALSVSAPAKVKRGASAHVSINAGMTPLSRHVYHVEVANPGGKVVAHYSQNILAEGGRAATAIPFAANDDVGTWRVSIRDAATGQTATAAIDLL